MLLQAFTEHYYNTFDASRANLAGLYQDGSMLTFEGSKVRQSRASDPILATLVHAHATRAQCPAAAPLLALKAWGAGLHRLDRHSKQQSRSASRHCRLFHAAPEQAAAWS